MLIAPYLFFNGNCEEAFQAYERILGGRIIRLFRYAGSPEIGMVPPEWQDKVMHACLMVGEALLMASDAMPGCGGEPPKGFTVNLGLDDAAEAERIFAALAEAGTIQMPIAETFWAYRFGMLTDRFGTPWMISFVKPEVTGAFEISRRFEVPVARLYQAFTDPERMRQWWGPKGFQVIASEMDLRPGGTYHYGLRSPTGTEMWGLFRYQAIIPEQRLVLVSCFSDPDRGITRSPFGGEWPLEMLSTFRFSAQDGHATLTVSWVPINPTPAERAAFDAHRDSMTQGWTGTLDQLEAWLAAG